MPDIFVNPIAPVWDDTLNQWGAKIFEANQNPVHALHESQNNWNDGNRLIGNFSLDITDIFTKGLSFRAQYGISKNFSHYKSYYPKYKTDDVQNQRLESNLNEGRSENQNWNYTNYLTYVKDFGLHSINTTLGAEAQEYKGANLDASRYDVPLVPNLWYMSESINVTDFTLNGRGSHNSLLSAFARANYVYNRKYLATVTMRADGSSKFKKEERWGYFPSFSLGWNVHQESFLQNLHILSQLKLRGGWGQVGNDSGAGNSDYIAFVSKGYNYVFGNEIVGGATQREFANSEIHWEVSEQLNLGVDFGLFNNKLRGSLDYFIRDTKDMVIPNPVPMYAGLGRPNANVGTMQNKGLELVLNYSDRTESGFEYDFNFNISRIRNKVTGLSQLSEIPGGDIFRLGYTTLTREGFELATFWGLKTDGIFKTQDEIDQYAIEGVKIQPDAVPGDVKYIDLNGDGKINGDDNTKLGSGWADFTGGFNASFAYKGFDLSLFLQGTYGNDLVYGKILTLYNTVVNETNVSKDMINRFPNGDMPRISNDDNNNNRAFSDRYIEDGSYLRIRNLQLGYTLPQSLFSKIGVSRLRIYISGENLKTFSSYNGLDPEIYAQYGNALHYGVDNGTYPVPRTFTGGINITF